MGFLGGLARAAIPAVTGLMQGQMAGRDRQRQQQMEALQAMLLQERLNEIPLARKDREQDRARQSLLDTQAENDRQFNQKRLLRQDKAPGPESMVEGLGPDGKPGYFAVPRGGQARPVGVAPIPKPEVGGGFKSVAQLRREFNGFVKPYEGLAQAFRKINGAASDPSAAGDLSVIFGYMKLLDPTSVVRESEQATASNAAGVPDRVRNIYNRVMTGERLTPGQRDDFVRQAQNLLTSQRSALASQINRYRAIAEANGIDSEQVVYDPFEGIGGQGATGLPGSDAGAPPSAQEAFERWKQSRAQ